MSRIYYNTGVSGRTYSNLRIHKASPSSIGVTIHDPFNNRDSLDCVLNREQIEDLIANLQSMFEGEKPATPLMEGTF